MAAARVKIPLATRLGAIIPVGLLGACGIVMAIVMLNITHTWPFDAARPTLVSQAAGPVEGEPLPLALERSEDKRPVARFRIPAGWAVDGRMLKRDGQGSIILSAWQVSPGVDVAGAEQRRAVAILQSRVGDGYTSSRLRLGPAAEFTVAGRPAIEVPTTTQHRAWSELTVYVYAGRTVIEIRCSLYDDWTPQLRDACAAVALTLEVLA